MKDKINVAELLKDCPQGMELDCVMFDNVTFVRVDNSRKQFPIEIAVGGLHSKYLTKEGCFHDTTLLPEAKCVIFPKGKTTWEGFQRPFKDGDIAISDIGDIHLLQTADSSYCAYRPSWQNLPKFDSTITTRINIKRLATEEEKEILFQVIKDKGYKWNPETKTLEKLVEPIFKVGDKVKRKYVDYTYIVTISEIEEYYYTCVNENGQCSNISIKGQDDWELVPDKFDINTLKHFDKVLVRQNDYDKWGIEFFGFYDKGFYYTTGNCIYKQCIPYESNEYLLKTNDSCKEYYKTW